MSVNNPSTDSQLAAALQQIVYVGTKVPSGAVFVREFNKMINTSQFPAINITGGGWHRARNSRSTYAGTQIMQVTYYNRFDQTNTTIEDLWIAICNETEIIGANIENNETLLIGQTSYNISINGISVGPDEPDAHSKISTDSGLTLLKRDVHVSYLIMPYTVAAVFPNF